MWCVHAYVVLQGFNPASSLTTWTLSGGTDPNAGNTPYQPALFSPVKVRRRAGCTVLFQIHGRPFPYLQSTLPWPANGNLTMTVPPQTFVILLATAA